MELLGLIVVILLYIIGLYAINKTNNFVLYKDYGVMPTIGLTYNTKHIDLSCDLFGNALITSIKYKF